VVDVLARSVPEGQDNDMEGERLHVDMATIIDALGRCVPEIADNDMDEVLLCFPQLKVPNPFYPNQSVESIKLRYKQEGSARFLEALEYAACATHNVGKITTECVEESCLKDLFNHMPHDSIINTDSDFKMCMFSVYP